MLTSLEAGVSISNAAEAMDAAFSGCGKDWLIEELKRAQLKAKAKGGDALGTGLLARLVDVLRAAPLMPSLSTQGSLQLLSLRLVKAARQFGEVHGAIEAALMVTVNVPQLLMVGKAGGVTRHGLLEIMNVVQANRAAAAAAEQLAVPKRDIVVRSLPIDFSGVSWFGAHRVTTTSKLEDAKTHVVTGYTDLVSRRARAQRAASGH